MIVPDHGLNRVSSTEAEADKSQCAALGGRHLARTMLAPWQSVRAEEALARIVAGESVCRREPKVPYNGADGVPIREEVLGRYGDEVITRNAYGARCLNSPTALFADVDFDNHFGICADSHVRWLC